MSQMRYKALVLDVDGTMTDGGIILDDNAVQSKRFDVSDGSGIKYFQRAGGVVALLTGRTSRVVEHRAEELGVKFVLQGAKDKAPAFEQLCGQMGIAPKQAAYMGDDLPDVPAMRLAGLAIAPSNAAAEVRAMVHHVTAAAGGHGAVREAVEFLLARDGLWKGILARYGLDGAIDRLSEEASR